MLNIQKESIAIDFKIFCKIELNDRQKKIKNEIDNYKKIF